MCNDMALSYVPQRDRAELLHTVSVNTLRSLLFCGDGDGRLGLGLADGELLLGVLLREPERNVHFHIQVDGSR